jgi:hypothetical protein
MEGYKIYGIDPGKIISSNFPGKGGTGTNPEEDRRA